ncbi:hypothetical protein [Streptomyces mirabilis]|uniref:hypothetical protein n=1 Tax=Streptomyces mirabilis TaxID=68239 RepID=UPI00367DCD6C
MNASHWKRSVVLVSSFLLAFAPVGLQQASAAPPIGTHAKVVTVAPADRDYQRGYRDGFRAGYADARNDCSSSLGANSDSSYARGYSAGYSAGFARGEARYCQ